MYLFNALAFFTVMVILPGCGSNAVKPDVAGVEAVTAAVSDQAAKQPEPVPPDASGIDVPDTAIKRVRAYTKPGSNDKDAVFSAMKDNKYAIQSAEEDKELMRAFMVLSHSTGARIVIHDMSKLGDGRE